MPEPLLTADFLRRLEQLELTTRKILVGRLKGDRRSKRRGASVEFADHRSYVSGDDLRFLDVNAYIRLDKLFIKLFEEEEDLHFHLLIDTSASMDFGTPAKLRYAQQIAAALAFVGLRNNDRVVVSAFADDLHQALPPQRGRQAFWRASEFIGNLTAAAGSNLTQTCRTFSFRNPSKGVVVLISDLLDKSGFEAGLRYLLANQMDVYVLHLLSKEEVRPELAGDLRLVDCEDGDVAEISVSAPLLARYQANLSAFCSAAKDFCTKRGMTYVFTTTELPFETLVLNWLRARGLLQ